jgi:pimeloyl-ACP methyl ester carboxylesterase
VPVTRTLTVGELAFDALAAGPEDGEPVLLLHGFPEGAQCWRLVLPLLAAAGLRAVAPDQRGYSPGARPTTVAAYGLDPLVGDVLGLLDALGWQRAHLVGHDWGAVVAWATAAGHPDRVATLTAVSVPHPAAFTAALAADPDQRTRSAYIGLFRTEQKAEQVLLADDGAALRAMFAGSGLEAAEVAQQVAAVLRPGALTAALAWYRANGADEMATVGEVAVPTSYVWGPGDIAVGRTAAYGAAVHVTGPYRFVELAGVGHWVPEQAPAELAEVVVDRVRGGGQPRPASAAR